MPSSKQALGHFLGIKKKKTTNKAIRDLWSITNNSRLCNSEQVSVDPWVKNTQAESQGSGKVPKHALFVSDISRVGQCLSISSSFHNKPQIMHPSSAFTIPPCSTQFWCSHEDVVLQARPNNIKPALLQWHVSNSHVMQSYTFRSPAQ